MCFTKPARSDKFRIWLLNWKQGRQYRRSVHWLTSIHSPNRCTALHSSLSAFSHQSQARAEAAAWSKLRRVRQLTIKQSLTTYWHPWIKKRARTQALHRFWRVSHVETVCPFRWILTVACPCFSLAPYFVCWQPSYHVFDPFCSKSFEL